MSPRAFIYTRISSPQQRKGRGLRIQSEMASDYCRNHKLTIDNSLVLKDEGQSAYHGHNISIGKLGMFLRLVQDGKVPIGSYLIFQSLDRMSRQDALTAVGTFNKIISAGINVVTLFPERTYTREALQDNQYSVIEIVVTFIRAFEESYLKSKRHKENWKRKRQSARNEGKLLTNKIPMWLKHNGKSFEPIPERVDTIRYIFELAYKGHGKRYIANRLNEANKAAPGTYPPWRSDIWQTSSIGKLLVNRQLIGEYQPHHYETKANKRKRVPQGQPIEGYFPKVIQDTLFYAVQERLSNKPIITGSQRTINNLFTGLIQCGLCYSNMVYDDKTGKRNQSPTAKYLVCSKSKNRAGCERHKLTYDRWEAQFLSELLEIDIDSLLKYSGNERAQRAEELKMKIAEFNMREKQIDKSISNLLELLDMDMPDIKSKLNELNEERKTIQDNRSRYEEDYKGLTEYANKTWADFRSIEEIKQQMETVEDNQKYEFRLRLRNAINDLVNGIWYYPYGTVDLDLRELFDFEGTEYELPDDIRDIKGIKSPCCIVAINKPRYLDDSFHGFFIKIILD